MARRSKGINARQATVDAGGGLLSVHAGHDINIRSGAAQTVGSYSAQSTDKGLLSRTTTKVSGSYESSTSVGSSFSGGLLAMTAGNNIAIEGAHVSGTQGVLVDAANDLAIVEGRSTSGMRIDVDKTRKGINAGAALGG
ncbi:hemagglutinin repeat-containing protein, partial [Variovorax humicola]